MRDISKLSAGLGDEEINNVAASFQDTATDILSEKAIEACRRERVDRLVMGGGVSANSRLREKISEKAAEGGIELFLPEKKLCVDNAAMVAGLGGALYKKKRKGGL